MNTRFYDVSTVASNQIFKDLRGQTNDPCEKADSPPASKGVSDNGQRRQIIITATIRDSTTASGKLGNLKELLQKAAIGTSVTYRVLLPAHPTPGTLARTYIV
jgi:hypothetical protein